MTHMANKERTSAPGKSGVISPFFLGFAAFFLLFCLFCLSGCGNGSLPGADASSGNSSLPTLTLRYEAAEGGSLQGQTEQALQAGSTGTAVTAVPGEGYCFTGWSDGLETPSRSDVIYTDTSYTALFKRQYTIRFVSSPAGAGSFTGEATWQIPEGERCSEVQALAAPGYRFSMWSDGETAQTHPAFSPTEDMTLYAVYEEIPEVSSLYITTEGEKKITSRSEYLTAAVRAEAAIETYQTGELSCRIRGHGNSSWDNFKNTKPSYRLKLDEKTRLLGVGESPGKDYVLLSNHGDATMLRNYTVLSFGQMLEHISYVPSSKFVHLYVNGEYRGLYQLCEKIKTGSGRLEIGDKEEETDIGYLLELDKRAGQKESDVYFTVDGIPFAVKSDGRSDAQLEFIKDFMKRFHGAVQKGERSEIDALANIPSIIDMFILEEFSKDRDVGFASFYLIKEAGGKLYFSCPWDFDLSLGNDSMFRYPRGLVTESDSANPFFASLMKRSWFREEVTARLREIAPLFDTLITQTAAAGELLREPVAMDDERWHIYGKRLLWEPDMVCFALHNYDEHLNYLLKWMRERADWLLDRFDIS